MAKLGAELECSSRPDHKLCTSCAGRIGDRFFFFSSCLAHLLRCEGAQKTGPSCVCSLLVQEVLHEESSGAPAATAFPVNKLRLGEERVKAESDARVLRASAARFGRLRLAPAPICVLQCAPVGTKNEEIEEDSEEGE